MKHTPAPWIFNQEEMKIKGSGDYEGMTVIANVSPKMDYSRGWSTQCANAKLIAAAPELLDACINTLKDIQKLNTQLISEGKHGYILMENELNNVIQKATKP